MIDRLRGAGETVRDRGHWVAPPEITLPRRSRAAWKVHATGQRPALRRSTLAGGPVARPGFNQDASSRQAKSRRTRSKSLDFLILFGGIGAFQRVTGENEKNQLRLKLCSKRLARSLRHSVAEVPGRAEPARSADCERPSTEFGFVKELPGEIAAEHSPKQFPPPLNPERQGPPSPGTARAPRCRRGRRCADVAVRPDQRPFARREAVGVTKMAGVVHDVAGAPTT